MLCDDILSRNEARKSPGRVRQNKLFRKSCYILVAHPGCYIGLEEYNKDQLEDEISLSDGPLGLR